ncbi:hypothetical protein EJB05_34327 [Eragrostis curvula]|uniref:Uncharacterized protein n=1 Tax=Eragrostis curvula TaxID=38414 RepID=A0A5J9U3J6_9POAL|nr:hypothetical protein EJB05_34327 [Eragrostis curvula]
MVLRRKKLKQKLDTLLPDNEAGAEDPGAEAQALKERLLSSKRPRPKRPPRKKLSPEEEEALRLQAEEEWRKEVELKREERRKEKKEKRRIRRLMEAEAAAATEETQKVEGEVESEAEDKEDPVEFADPAVGSDHPVMAEDREQNVDKVEVTKPGVGSNNSTVANDREQRNKMEVAKHGAVSDNPVITENMEQSIKKVYVGGIPYYSSEDDIRSFFEACGSITAVDCMTFPESGKFRGIAILTFKMTIWLVKSYNMEVVDMVQEWDAAQCSTDAAAQRALALDGADMGGFYLKIQPYKANKSDRVVRQKEDFAPELIEGYNRIYAGNLPWDITEDDIKKFLSDCKISSIRFGKDKETGDFKGYAHVDFSDSTSLAVALKLDQKVIKGRPVRIRCAVPKKDNQKVNDNGNSDHPKNKIRTCYECGTPGHLSSSCPNKKDSEVTSDEKKINVDSATASSKKRRTCYECGTPGHLSSACPNKRAADSLSNNREPDDDAKPSPTIVYEEKKVGDESNAAPSKKRRTCYECGTPGHLSSACPNKKAAYSVSNNREPDDNAKTATTTMPEEKNVGDESNSAPSKKRRKCYECGIPGHLSSACPNKKASEIVRFEDKSEIVSETAPSAVADEMKVSDDTKPVPAKKKKRRTCYECGIAGHLSSECPNKTAAEVK